MADLTANVQAPSAAGVTPSFGTCNASDFFTAQPNACYVLHYVNGATPTGALAVVDATTQPPSGATPAAGWANLVHTPASLGASTQKKVTIGNSSRFRDSNGRINLTHVTPTTLTLNIEGPFPALG